MATVQVANNSKRLITVNYLSKGGVQLRQRLNPGVTPVDKADWDEMVKIAFVKHNIDKGDISTAAGDVKKGKEVNKEAEA